MAAPRTSPDRKAPELRIPLADRREARALRFFTFAIWCALIPFPLVGFVVTRSAVAAALVAVFFAVAALVTYVMKLDHRERRNCELVLDQKGIRLERCGRERWRARWSEVAGWRASREDRQKGAIAILLQDGRVRFVPADGGLQIEGRYERIANSIGEFCDEIKS